MQPEPTRRSFLRLSAAGLATAALVGCGDEATAYERAASELRRPLAAAPEAAELVRFATLAASGHNTQPWRFETSDAGLSILPDFSRATPVVDPDDHHLYASLGCAAENLVHAARARGLAGDVAFEASGQGRAEVSLEPAAAEETAFFRAIPARQCCRAAYDGRAAPADVMSRLVAAANSHGVDAVFLTEEARMEDVLALVVEGNSRQMDDPAFVAELKRWLRFNAREAMRQGDGLYSAASGNPTMPSWIAPVMFDLFFTKGGENSKYAEHVRSSAGLAVFVGPSDDPAGWFAAGRACQRFALQATADGLKYAFVNQAVEVPEARAELQSLLGLGGRRPDLVVRFGYGPDMPRSLRRPPGEVMARAGGPRTDDA